MSPAKKGLVCQYLLLQNVKQLQTLVTSTVGID